MTAAQKPKYQTIGKWIILGENMHIDLYRPSMTLEGMNSAENAATAIVAALNSIQE